MLLTNKKDSPTSIQDNDTTEIWQVAHDLDHITKTCCGEDELPQINTYIRKLKYFYKTK